MYSLLKKEIKTFLGSLIGYLAILVFLLVTGLFLWVFPGNYNVLDSGYATLEGLFELAPWLYLFLVPAITMRMFADEKRTGTVEILLTRPVSDFKIVFAKFLAGLVLVVFSLLPTLLYFVSVYYLGNPVGSIDTGATWGSFWGLFFLATIYVAIGVFASSLTDNQIVSFILATLLSFVFYLGFSFVASAGVSYNFERFFTWLGIDDHYKSISRGVVDMRDILYFFGMTYLFLFFTALLLRKGKLKKTKNKIKAVVVPIVVFLILALSSNFLFRYDLTSDKRYTLSPISRYTVSQLKKPVEIEFYLAGELEPGLRKIQTEVLEKIAAMNTYAGSPIRVKLFSPYQITNEEEREKLINELVYKGVPRISLRHKTEQGVASKFIFPGALIRYNDKEIAVNFLKNNPYTSYENNFNHSIETIEFELVNAMHKLIKKKKSVLAFLQGEGEANQYEVSDIAQSLSVDFIIDMVEASELPKSDVDILVVANPKSAFTEKSKFAIDQFIMNGGKVVWMVNPVQVSLDSLTRGFQTYSFPKNINLSDQLFRYGVRLNYDLLQDANCLQIQVNTAAPGNSPKYTTAPWYYSPLLTPNDNHPISRNLNWVKSEFVSSIDTITHNPKINKTVILSTSPYARKIKAPSSVSLANINNPPARALFNQADIPVGVLLEGVFTSNYKNRMVEEYGVSSSDVIPESKPTKMLIFSDGELLCNKVKYSTDTPQIQELGYDRVSGQVFGNKDFMMNAIYYLDDKAGIMELRSRSLKMRLLDKVKIHEEKGFWQLLNIMLPLVLMIVFGLIYNIIRKYKYTRS